MKKECQCDICQQACRKKPGWFKPGEAEKAAELMGLTLKEFFDKYLMVDWWVGSPTIFTLSPAIKGYATGQEFPFHPNGECVFFEDGLCNIHPAKPFECAEMMHDDPAPGRHEAVAMSWKEHQDQIRELLGREPKETEPESMADIMRLL